jgi:hypothetical protein
MRTLVFAAAFAAVAFTAYAQDMGAPAVPPSSCEAIPPAPTPPNGARANATQIQAAVAQYEAWNASATAIMQCRAQEVRGLQAQVAARTAEYDAGLAAGRDAGAAWQAQLDAFQARQNRR